MNFLPAPRRIAQTGFALYFVTLWSWLGGVLPVAAAYATATLGAVFTSIGGGLTLAAVYLYRSADEPRERVVWAVLSLLAIGVFIYALWVAIDAASVLIFLMLAVAGVLFVVRRNTGR